MTTKEPRSKRMIVKVMETEIKAYRKTADARRMDLSEWVRSVLNAEAEKKK